MIYQEKKTEEGYEYQALTEHKPIWFMSEKKLNGKELDAVFEKAKGVYGKGVVEVQKEGGKKRVVFINSNSIWNEDNEKEN